MESMKGDGTNHSTIAMICSATGVTCCCMSVHRVMRRMTELDGRTSVQCASSLYATIAELIRSSMTPELFVPIVYINPITFA